MELDGIAAHLDLGSIVVVVAMGLDTRLGCGLEKWCFEDGCRLAEDLDDRKVDVLEEASRCRLELGLRLRWSQLLACRCDLGFDKGWS